MKRLVLPLLAVLALPVAVNANDFGNADFPSDVEVGSPKSYHDAFCRQLNRKCRVRFTGRKMFVEGFKGIERNQLIGYRSKTDIEVFLGTMERYFYVDYMNSKGEKSTALFLFTHTGAAREFGLALARWHAQDPRPQPNYDFPNSQGPQDTHGRDKGLNPFEN